MTDHRKGNKFARKENPATASVLIRVRPDQKEQYQAAAKREGLSLSAWAIREMDKAAGRGGEDKGK